MGRDGVRLVFKTPASMKGRRDMVVASIVRKGRGGGGGSAVELERGGSTEQTKETKPEEKESLSVQDLNMNLPKCLSEILSIRILMFAWRTLPT